MVLVDPHTKFVQANDNYGRLPQPKDYRGILVACTVIGTWGFLFYHSMFQINVGGDNPTNIVHVLLAFFALEYLYTGLFITAHDAMHGAIAFKNRKLNDFIGHLAVTLYAWFDYPMLHKNHWEHHDHTGRVGLDPDFHRGDPNVLLWFCEFMKHYMSPAQIMKLTIWSVFLLACGAPMRNILVYMTAAPILSSFRLFYWGTYIPHRPGVHGKDAVMNWEKSYTSPAPRFLSMLKCYHFDYHWEHHRWPYSPWWQLPEYRNLVIKKQEVAAMKSPPNSQQH